MLMGVRVTSPMRTPTPSSSTLISCMQLLIFILSCTFMSLTLTFGVSDSDILLQFKDTLTQSESLENWDLAVLPPCNVSGSNWVGVLCLDGQVRGLQLDSMGLEGVVDFNSLVSLSGLSTLSFMNNTLVGTWPADIKKLDKLRALYLSYNHFWGEIPDDAFAGMNLLKKVLLSNNNFRGKIPSSLASLPNLMDLRIDGNKFQGTLPDFVLQTRLERVNASNNELEGPIPETLKPMDPSYFSGNKNLCGAPLESCNSSSNPNPSPSPSPSPSPNPISILEPAKTDVSSLDISLMKIAIIVMAVGILLVTIAAAIFIFILKRQEQQGAQGMMLVRNSSSLDDKKYDASIYSFDKSQTEHKLARPHMAATAIPRKKGDPPGKLTFVRQDRARFDLHDLLRSSAEILGSGTFGASYKAMIFCDSVVVKRYKQMNNVEREEFHEHMRSLGRLSHPNLLPLVAYYYRKEEKLLISDFMENGSLASILHGSHNVDHPNLDWPTRLRIIKGIARGLSYLYNVLPSRIVPHGNLKSSNVLLDESFEPLLSDYALLPVINQEQAPRLMMAYKAPEYTQHERITKKTDVWSFGIVILEILTGKFPENYLTPKYNSNADLASWVNTMITDKRTTEVFDVEMGEVSNSKGQLLKLLKIGLSCCEEDVERRLNLNEAIIRIEQLDEGEGDLGLTYQFSHISSNENDGSRAM